MQLQVLLVAGTHGNEINGIWLFEQWEKSPFLINTNGIKTFHSKFQISLAAFTNIGGMAMNSFKIILSLGY